MQQASHASGLFPGRARRYVQAELVHCRTAMAAVAGILIPSVSALIARWKGRVGTVGFFSLVANQQGVSQQQRQWEG